MKKSAGILFIYNNKILLEHPTNAAWVGTYSIPKGLVDPNESVKEAAYRETKEELGIEFDMALLADQNLHEILYIKKSKCYKIVYYYVVYLSSLNQLGIDSEIIPKEQLQLDEVDWAGFVGYNDAQHHIFHRQQEVLKYIKNDLVV